MNTFEMYQKWNGKVYGGYIYVNNTKVLFTSEMKEEFDVIAKKLIIEEMEFILKEVSKKRVPTLVFNREIKFYRANFRHIAIRHLELSLDELIEFCTQNSVRIIELSESNLQNYEVFLKEKIS